MSCVRIYTWCNIGNYLTKDRTVKVNNKDVFYKKKKNIYTYLTFHSLAAHFRRKQVKQKIVRQYISTIGTAIKLVPTSIKFCSNSVLNDPVVF